MIDKETIASLTIDDLLQLWREREDDMKKVRRIYSKEKRQQYYRDYQKKRYYSEEEYRLHIIAKNSRSNKEHSEKINARRRQWYSENKERIRAYQREYYASHPRGKSKEDTSVASETTAAHAEPAQPTTHSPKIVNAEALGIPTAKSKRVAKLQETTFEAAAETRQISDKDKLAALYLEMSELEDNKGNTDFESWWRKRNTLQMKINNLEAWMKHPRAYRHS